MNCSSRCNNHTLCSSHCKKPCCNNRTLELYFAVTYACSLIYYVFSCDLVLPLLFPQVNKISELSGSALTIFVKEVIVAKAETTKKRFVFSLAV